MHGRVTARLRARPSSARGRSLSEFRAGKGGRGRGGARLSSRSIFPYVLYIECSERPVGRPSLDLFRPEARDWNFASEKTGGRAIRKLAAAARLKREFAYWFWASRLFGVGLGEGFGLLCVWVCEMNRWWRVKRRMGEMSLVLWDISCWGWIWSTLVVGKFREFLLISLELWFEFWVIWIIRSYYFKLLILVVIWSRQ